MNQKITDELIQALRNENDKLLKENQAVLELLRVLMKHLRTVTDKINGALDELPKL